MQHTLILNQSKNNWDEKDKAMILAFIEYIFTILYINKPVTIKLDDASEDNEEVEVKLNLRLAYVDLDTRIIIIYCKNRGLLDILRSMAHELIHIQQKDLGLLDNTVNISFYLPTPNSEGYEFEYEAYGLSGIIVRNFRAILNGAADNR